MSEYLRGRNVICLTDKYRGLTKYKHYRIWGFTDTCIKIISDYGNLKLVTQKNFQLLPQYQEGGDGWKTI